MQTIHYRVIDHGGESFYHIDLPTAYDPTRPMEQIGIAKRCAEDYHANHNGWDSSWPLTFALHTDEDGPEIARLTVEREMEPEFYARRVEPC